MKIKLYTFVCIIGWVAITSSCNKKNDYSSNVDIIREWNFTISSSNENSLNTGTEANATFHLVVAGDKSIRYDIQVDTSVSDKIATAQINLGDPVTDGRLLLDLPVRVYSTYASGVLTGLNQSLIDTLLNNSIDKYINVTSVSAPAGLVRGQLNSTIVFSKNVALSGKSVVPSVTTTAAGTAYLRLMSDSILYSKVVVNNDPADPATAATINQGSSSANGPVVMSLASSAQEFGTDKKTTVSPSVYSTLLSNSTYVNVSSALNPNGVLRGQIR